MYTFPESIITPAALINDSINTDMLSLVFGPRPGYVNKSDFLPKYNLYNIYRISSSLYKIINEKFPGCNESHQFSILPGIGDGGITILCVFYNNGCSIRLQNGEDLLFTNYFVFTVPSDIVYYLLSICNNFNVDVQNVSLILSGLIEKDSILYKEIYKYFLSVSFLSSSTQYTCQEGFNDYPQHYFNYLFEIATCV
ncbi:MAG: DUF3822 family protein [Chitinophagaceae bacterium]|nr:DUF3822 family protein [Chitinophagaceae bacterium]